MLNNVTKIDKRLFKTYFKNSHFKTITELKECILASDDVALANRFLDDFGIDEDIVKYIISKINRNDYHDMCDKLITLVGLDRVTKIVGIDQLLDKIIISSELYTLINYAEKFESINDYYAVKILEDEVISRGNSMYIYQFALKIKNSNKENLATALVSLKDAIYIRKMAESFPSFAKELTLGIIQAENEQEMIKFMLDIKNCPIGLIITHLNLDQKGKLILISALLQHDVIKYHFYAEAILNNQDLSIQDSKYMKYCQNYDQSLPIFLTDELQLKNHTHVKLKTVYKN